MSDAAELEDLRSITCEYCGGDGCFEEVYWSGHEPVARFHRCSACRGTGDEWVKTELVDMEDLDDGP